MSELQLSLIIIGALVVVAVLIYNRMQERAAQRNAERTFRSAHADVLMATPDADEDAGADAAPRQPDPRHRAADDPGAVQPDARIDYVMELRPAATASSADLREQWPSLARRLRERVTLFELPDGCWLAGLQLVSRAGVTGEADLIEFRSEVEALAARLGFQVTAPEMKAALAAASEQDAFCAERDIQVALHVVSRSQDGFERTGILAIGERFGLAADGEGRLELVDSAQRLLFQVADRSGARLDAAGPASSPPLALSFTMDVPRVPDTRRTFETMARMAGAMCTELDCTLVDDNGTALDERSLASIGAQLDAVRAELEARGLPPGGVLARRVFS